MRRGAKIIITFYVTCGVKICLAPKLLHSSLALSALFCRTTCKKYFIKVTYGYVDIQPNFGLRKWAMYADPNYTLVNADPKSTLKWCGSEIRIKMMWIRNSHDNVSGSETMTAPFSTKSRVSPFCHEKDTDALMSMEQCCGSGSAGIQQQMKEQITQ